MSKDKGGKNVKKAPNADHEKKVSDYQAGKQSIGSNDIINKKK
ncbi:MAG TPA: hypothetical protein VL442_18485 [Mucilaginibacter sp.]|jgi:hypothetical protein|nr:hypothetical protein [Mucilaginibacter sp.]